MKTFFEDFPKVQYNDEEVVNILTAFFLRRVSIDKSLVFQKLSVKDSDIPESISNDLYKTTRHYWTLLLVNDCVNPYTDWLMTDESLESYSRKKYENGIQFKLKDGTYRTLQGSVGINGVHHFFNQITERVCDDVEDEYYRGLWIQDSSYLGMNIIPVTNLSYEREMNEKKRQILIVNPRAIVKFEDDFKRVLVK